MINKYEMESASKTGSLVSVEKTFEIARKMIEKALTKISARTGMFDAKDVKIYMQGSYKNYTNVFTASDVEIVVELEKTQYFDPSKLTPNSYAVTNNYYVLEASLGAYTVEHFRADLAIELDVLTNRHLAKQTRRSILIDEYNELPRRVDVLPAFSFKSFKLNQNGEMKSSPGVLFWDSEENYHIISFPRKHEENIDKKDLETNGYFKKMIRIFKTLRVLASKHDLILKSKAPGYFIECLLYNVPNELFFPSQNIFDKYIDMRPKDVDKVAKEGEILQNLFQKIINYLINADIRDFRCINGKWTLFGNAAEFWTIPLAEEFIYTMIMVWQNPEQIGLTVDE